MAEFCLECFKRFEPNANEDNTTLSNYLDWCEGCAELRQVVVDFEEKQVTIQDNLTLYCPICKTPLYQYDKKIANSTSAHVKSRCDNCGSNYHWMEYINKIGEHKVAGFSSFWKPQE